MFCSLLLLVLVVISLSLNVYLAWELSGFDISISRPVPVSTGIVTITPSNMLVAAATDTPELESTGTPTPESTEAPVATLTSTLTVAAMDTPPGLESSGTPTPAPTETRTTTPTNTPAAVAMNTPELESISTPIVASPEIPTPTPTRMATAIITDSAASALVVPENLYALIPIEGENDDRPAEETSDLNLKLRGPEPIEAELSLVDIEGPANPDAPKLSAIFQPNFTATYGVHDWDLECDCQGELLQDAVLVGIATRPDQPVFIPKTKQAIYQDQYYAMLLYASEDSVTFVSSGEGTISSGYTVYYLGLKTDPNLLATYRQSEGNELPGLTLDTPIGIATEELIVAIRDQGKFVDARSREWWD